MKREELKTGENFFIADTTVNKIYKGKFVGFSNGYCYLQTGEDESLVGWNINNIFATYQEASEYVIQRLVSKRLVEAGQLVDKIEKVADKYTKKKVKLTTKQK